MTAWPITLCQALAACGYRVIRFDNRDAGLSSKLDHLKTPPWHLVAAVGFLGFKFGVPYDLSDMMMDLVGLLDSFDIDQAHIVGASMGGMVAQLMAAHHPERVLTLTAVMTTSGDRKLPRAKLFSCGNCSNQDRRRKTAPPPVIICFGYAA